MLSGFTLLTDSFSCPAPKSQVSDQYYLSKTLKLVLLLVVFMSLIALFFGGVEGLLTYAVR